ncbi:MAG: hypothetical protein FWD32_01525, partial [Firmicutes bacterium]|nr:hypothetical protein [Bacillota bacterium]
KSFSMSQTVFTEKSGINELNKALLATQTNKIIYAFTNLGNCFKIDATAIPDAKWKDKGLSFKTLVKGELPNEKVVNIFALDGETLPKGDLLFLTKNGMIKKSAWSEYGILKSYFQAVKLNDGDELIALEQDLPDTTILLVSKSGMVLNALKDDVPNQGRVSAGVRGINLTDGDYCVFNGQIAKKGGEIIICGKDGLIKRVKQNEVEPMARYRKGLKICATDIVFADYANSDTTYVAVNDDGTLTGLALNSIASDTRVGKGKKFKGISNSFSNIYKFKNKP